MIPWYTWALGAQKSKTHGEMKQAPTCKSICFKNAFLMCCQSVGSFCKGHLCCLSPFWEGRSCCVDPMWMWSWAGAPIAAVSPSPGACGTNAGGPPPARRPLNQVVADSPEHRMWPQLCMIHLTPSPLPWNSFAEKKNMTLLGWKISLKGERHRKFCSVKWRNRRISFGKYLDL